MHRGGTATDSPSRTAASHARAPARAPRRSDTTTTTTRRGASAGAVLRTILEHGPIARSTIARLTGLSPASITGHTAELAQLGLIRESPDVTRSNGMGRPHVPIDLNADRHVVGAVHIAVPYTTIALLDLRGRVIAKSHQPHPHPDTDTPHPSPSDIAERAAHALAALLDEHTDRATPLGLGVATGGRVDQESGVVEHPLLGWRDAPLRELFATYTGLPTHVDGHSRALLQGERLFGAARGHDSALLLFIGNVVDAAFAAGERVHYGPRSQAGGIAHLPLDGNTERCPCGRRGCLQAAVSDKTLTRQALESGVIDTPDFTALLKAARRGDPAAERLFAERAHWLGQATAMLLDVFDPELVIVVEPGVMYLPDGLAALHSAVRERVSSELDATRTVVPTSFSDDVLAVAGGSVVLDAFYRDPLALLAVRT